MWMFAKVESLPSPLSAEIADNDGYERADGGDHRVIAHDPCGFRGAKSDESVHGNACHANTENPDAEFDCSHPDWQIDQELVVFHAGVFKCGNCRRHEQNPERTDR